MENIILCKEGKWHSSFASVTRLSKGEFLVSFGQCKVNANPVHQHLHFLKKDDFRRVFLFSDDGYTWNKRINLHMSGGPVTELPDKTLITIFFRWRFTPESEKEKLKRFVDLQRVKNTKYWAALEYTYYCRSFDRGLKWTEPYRINTFPFLTGAIRDSAKVLPDGEIILPLYGTRKDGLNGCYLIRSKDNGKTWGDVSLMTEGYCEPGLVVTESGKMIAHLRAGGECKCPDDFFIYQIVSEDKGKTWTKPERLPMWGFPADIIQLSDGRLLTVYGYRRPPFGIRACISEDEGKTWDYKNEIIIRDDFPGADIGYPSAVEIEPGKIFVVYYGLEENTLLRYIAGTYFKV
ncbi:exo-alpha-sialidase [bacterium]|nr:exo-alpha-sialidase [bacterium]